MKKAETVGVEAFGCVANTIRLRSGKYLDLRDPQPDQFTFADIAGALAKLCRFGGQCEWFYSVAEHSYHCAKQAAADGQCLETQAACLLHDAAEAFIGDIVKPLKIMLPEYLVIERRLEAVIFEKFLVQFHREESVVREIDRAMLVAERRFLFSRDAVEGHGENDVRRLTVEFKRWKPGDAEEMFVVRSKSIGINIEH